VDHMKTGDISNSTPCRHEEIEKAPVSYASDRHAEGAAVSDDKQSYYATLLRSPCRAERIIPILVKYIKDMNFVPGSKLTPEGELSNIVGVGIKSLREALQALKMIGLVESRIGKGWYVTEFKPFVNLPIVMAPVLEHFSRGTVRQLFEARLAIEPFTAGLAARNIKPEGRVRLGGVLDTMKTNVYGNIEDFESADKEFHGIIAEMCGNEILSLQNFILSEIFFPRQAKYLPKDNFHRVLGEHEEIYKKLMEGDADGAALAAKSHLEESIGLLKEHGLYY
jgi:GntR family transcriptional regulator, transcriptional repressor for pyruvate dehydrogenase complex